MKIDWYWVAITNNWIWFELVVVIGKKGPFLTVFESERRCEGGRGRRKGSLMAPVPSFDTYDQGWPFPFSPNLTLLWTCLLQGCTRAALWISELLLSLFNMGLITVCLVASVAFWAVVYFDLKVGFETGIDLGNPPKFTPKLTVEKKTGSDSNWSFPMLSSALRALFPDIKKIPIKKYVIWKSWLVSFPTIWIGWTDCAAFCAAPFGTFDKLRT